MRVNRSQMADILGIDVVVLDRKIKKGLPFVSKGAKGKQWVFDSGEVLQWEKERAVQNAIGDVQVSDLDELRRRKLAAETTISEVEAAKVRGEVSDLATLEKQWSETFTMFRSRMQRIPARCAPGLLGEDNEIKIKEIIMTEINEALKVLGEYIHE